MNSVEPDVRQITVFSARSEQNDDNFVFGPADLLDILDFTQMQRNRYTFFRGVSGRYKPVQSTPTITFVFRMRFSDFC